MVEGSEMSSSRDKILQRIDQALGNRTDSTDDVVERRYHQISELTAQEKVNLFQERVDEYKAATERVSEGELPGKLKKLCEEAGIKKLVLPPGIDENWLSELPKSMTFLHDEPQPLSKTQLNESDAVLTNCFLGVAQTGTIILNAGPGQGRRVLTLLPDIHICVIRQDQIVGILPEAIRKLDQTVSESGAPVTFISGPSATSDIELDRVEGVHGPRKLHVFIISES